MRKPPHPLAQMDQQVKATPHFLGLGLGAVAAVSQEVEQGKDHQLGIVMVEPESLAQEEQVVWELGQASINKCGGSFIMFFLAQSVSKSTVHQY